MTPKLTNYKTRILKLELNLSVQFYFDLVLVQKFIILIPINDLPSLNLFPSVPIPLWFFYDLTPLIGFEPFPQEEILNIRLVGCYKSWLVFWSARKLRGLDPSIFCKFDLFWERETWNLKWKMKKRNEFEYDRIRVGELSFSHHWIGGRRGGNKWRGCRFNFIKCSS